MSTVKKWLRLQWGRGNLAPERGPEGYASMRTSPKLQWGRGNLAPESMIYGGCGRESMVSFNGAGAI